jgi:hypothetical protein
MLKRMASLEFFIRKFGARRGREEYNAYHQKYRKRNRKKLALYQRNRRAAQKASIDGLSDAFSAIQSLSTPPPLQGYDSGL